MNVRKQIRITHNHSNTFSQTLVLSLKTWSWLYFTPVTRRRKTTTTLTKYLSCKWLDFDQTLKQMPTVMVTFVQATYVLMTFVHISNISAVTGLFCSKFWVKKNKGIKWVMSLKFWSKKVRCRKFLWSLKKNFGVKKKFWVPKTRVKNKFS